VEARENVGAKCSNIQLKLEDSIKEVFIEVREKTG
jgi:hypothetical protein